VQYVPHAPVDVQKVGCDFLACSSYKFFGPHLGILYGRYDLLANLQAYKVRPAPVEPPGKFETGTGNFEHIAGLLGTLEYFEWVGRTFGEEQYELYAENYQGRRLAYKVGMGALHAYNFELNRLLLDVLGLVPGLTIYGITDARNLEQRLPTFSFTLAGVSPEETARKLDEKGIFSWNGNFYALAVTERLGLESGGGVVRVGAVHYNTAAEVQRLGEALQEIVRDGNR
jgi:selenocysteine lyase/cysteine desulfurase